MISGFLKPFLQYKGLVLLMAGCLGWAEKESLRIDGSSTVYPITEAIVEEFVAGTPDVKITIGISGTGGGFKKFSRGESDINNASRPIKSGEASACRENNIDYLELRVAYDGLVVVVNRQNDWVDHLTVEELREIWQPAAQEKVTHWNQIRPDWPEEEFHLYGPGIASGTYDYFTEAVVGESGSSRGDFTSSEDDNVLVQGISGDRNGLGFFGLAYYEENKEKLKLVGIENLQGAITFPSVETVKNGTYAPLSRPMFIYVSNISLRRERVLNFVQFYLENVSTLVPDVGYIPLTDDEYEEEKNKLRNFITTSVTSQ